MTGINCVFLQWKGCGHLKRANGTSTEEALQNQSKATEILELPNIKKLTRRYEIADFGYYIISEETVKYKIGRRMTEMNRSNYNKACNQSLFVGI